MASYEEISGVEPIGRGGFAEVRFCSRTEDGAPFAKKVLVQEDADSQRRFRKEVEILRAIAGPKIMPVIDADLDANPPFYIMPLYNGSLRAVLPELVRDHSRISNIFRQVVDAVNHAHSLGVIHRDLNPNNILRNSDDDLVVSDFGLGRRLNSESTRATQSNARMGTSGYMAPEQYHSAEDADERSDIFALGVILNEMHTGTTALGMPLPAPALVIVRRCTNQNRDARFQTVADLRRAFENVMTVQTRRNAAEELRKLIEAGLRYDTADSIAANSAQTSDDARLLHELTVAIPADTFERLCQINPEIAALLVVKFGEVSISERWGFDYTDQIGDTCLRLFSVANDANLKASLIATALHVGVNYNRWHVEDVAARLLEANITDTDAVTILSELEPIRHYLVVVSDRVDKKKVHPILRALMDVAEEEYKNRSV
jgi:serine/threonine protein kinase